VKLSGFSKANPVFGNSAGVNNLGKKNSE